MQNKTVSITARLLATISYIQGPTRAHIAPASRYEIMKPKNLLLLPALIAVLNLLPVGQAPGQTFTTLYTINTADEGSPGLFVLSSNTLYGATSGSYEVFALNTDGTGFRVLTVSGYCIGLTLSGNTLYGSSLGSGDPPNSDSWLFAVNTDGTGYTNLYTFTPTSIDYDGAFRNTYGWGPMGVTLSGATLYGTTEYGGVSGAGTFFKVSTNGTGFSWTDAEAGSDGGLILSGDTLYGTDAASVFAINTNGLALTDLHYFSFVYGQSTNSDGREPGGLVLSGSTLYGAAFDYGAGGVGTVFALNVDGTGFRVLHSFTALSSTQTNSDGAYPNGLVLNGSTLYGTTSEGGSSGMGTVFAINTNGTGFTNLHTFTDTGDGAYPGRLFLSGNTFYGATSAGTVFSLSFTPQLTITLSGTHVILSWPTNVAGFDYTGYVLQSASNLVSPAVWSTNFPAPVVIAGRNTVTNEITGTQQFYRLIR
jgi:uncharacterized repeat protein (TIGR03803 family)